MARFYATVMIDTNEDFDLSDVSDVITQSISELSDGEFDYTVCEVTEH